MKILKLLIHGKKNKQDLFSTQKLNVSCTKLEKVGHILFVSMFLTVFFQAAPRRITRDLENRDFIVPPNLGWKRLAQELAKDRVRQQMTPKFDNKKGRINYDSEWNEFKSFSTFRAYFYDFDLNTTVYLLFSHLWRS